MKPSRTPRSNILTMMPNTVATQKSDTASDMEAIIALCRMVDLKDDFTGLHNKRIAAYCYKSAIQMGYSKEDALNISMAAKLHDIGKVYIPDAILTKKGKLTVAEYAEMKKHPQLGYQTLEHCKSNTMLVLAKEMALTHHERYDGSGYPHGLKRGDIPLMGRLLAVADVFDALIAQRSYKSGWKVDKAAAYIQQNGGILFDPDIVKAFIGVLHQIVCQKPFMDSLHHPEYHTGLADVHVVERTFHPAPANVIPCAT
jgi:putative two-component system response regulator